MPNLPFTEPRTWAENLCGEVLAGVFDGTDYEGVPVLLGQSEDKKTCPSVVAYCSQATVPADLPGWFRNYQLEMIIAVGSQAHNNTESPEGQQLASGLAAHKEMVALVMSKLSDENAFKTAELAAGHGIYFVEIGAVNEEREGLNFGSGIPVTIYAALDLPVG